MGIPIPRRDDALRGSGTTILVVVGGGVLDAPQATLLLRQLVGHKAGQGVDDQHQHQQHQRQHLQVEQDPSK